MDENAQSESSPKIRWPVKYDVPMIETGGTQEHTTSVTMNRSLRWRESVSGSRAAAAMEKYPVVFGGVGVMPRSEKCRPRGGRAASASARQPA